MLGNCRRISHTARLDSKRLDVSRLLAVVMMGVVCFRVQRTLAVDPDNYRDMYARYCSACHGRDGRGDGVVAPAFTTPPSDLTQLTASHGGTFPFAYVVQVIDGRKTIRAHGTSVMPVWGEVFSREEHPVEALPGSADEAAARNKIIRIAEYVRRLQRK